MPQSFGEYQRQLLTLTHRHGKLLIKPVLMPLLEDPRAKDKRKEKESQSSDPIPSTTAQPKLPSLHTLIAPQSL